MINKKTKKKSPTTTTKRKTNKKTSGINYKLINLLLIVIILLIVTIGLILYMLDTKELKKVNETIKETPKKIEITVNNATNELNKYLEQAEIKKDKFEEYTKDLYEEYVDKDTLEKLKDNVDNVHHELTKEPEKKTEEYKEQKIEKEVVVIDKAKPVLSTKAKLAIVIDDVTTAAQLSKIEQIGYTLNPSFMPPTKGHPNSAKIAQNQEFYMIHLPMQATSFKNEEENTLHINDSYEKIESRIAQIRQWYPKAKYTNNHTGSMFTENKEAMDKLYKALIKYDFIFVDSRTTGKTVAKEIAKKYNVPYISRNVFLDNEQNFNYIQTQLKTAVKLAKKNGFAIAICHPHSITLKTLKDSKELLKDLEMVYLNQLPILNK